MLLKYMLLFVLTISSMSCSDRRTTELKNDIQVCKTFPQEDVILLEEMVSFFDNAISNITDQNINIDQAYVDYFEKVSANESYIELYDEIALHSSDESKIMLKNLIDNDLFSDIYKYSYYHDPLSYDTLAMILDINLSGKYMSLIKKIGDKRIFYDEYVQTLLTCGGIAPGNIEQLMGFTEDVDFNYEMDRLLYAIHYFAICSKIEY